MGKVLDFLFGKSPKIFNKDGDVQHDLGVTKWKQWKDRFRKNPDYDFNHHRGRTDKVPPRKQH
jgi:glucose/arabinose dehydrogenase